MWANVTGKKNRVNPIGASAHLEQYSTTDIDTQLDSMQAAGVHWVRVEFIWDALQRTNGGAYTYTYYPYDHIVAGILSRSMQCIGLISQYNTAVWSRAGAPWNQPPSPSVYATICTTLATHYAGQVALWEIGNEPNQDLFWYPHFSASAYTLLLQAAYPAIKAADSTAKVMMAGISTNSPQSFLTAMYANGAQAYMDYVGFHPYCTNTQGPDLNANTSFNMLDNLKTIMTTNGDGNKPICATEIGWYNGTASGNTSEAAQAYNLLRVFQKIMQESYQYVLLACVYDYINDGNDLTNSQNNYGILRYDYSQKPSFASLQAAASIYSTNFTPIAF